MLAKKHCISCEGGMPHLMADEIADLHKEVPEWEIVDYHHLKRRAESEGHHPDIRFGWGYAEIISFTHAIGGLSENDFILTAKIDALFKR
ncbi:MAG: pterin-4-alpha-carbinolamine dehydratase [Parcubacteria group bacterium Greene0416_79]|nr:MAG: pterin-4-alpha-carbinolamine dehydratase [Parcubacteria group bacterium Greene0416_79]